MLKHRAATHGISREEEKILSSNIEKSESILPSHVANNMPSCHGHFRLADHKTIQGGPSGRGKTFDYTGIHPVLSINDTFIRYTLCKGVAIFALFSACSFKPYWV